MNRLLVKLPWVFLSLGMGTLQARVWTDLQGRKIEADMVRMDGGDPVVNLRGKETKLPAAKLSAGDVEFVAQWKTEHPDGAAATTTDGTSPPAGEAKPGSATVPGGAATLDGKPMLPDGKQNLVEKPFGPEALKDLKKSGETGFKLAVGVPPGFDAARPMKVYIVSTAVNSDAERVGGNIAKFNMYAGACAEQGWVCIAADTDKGVPATTHAIEAAFALLAKEWPGFAQSTFAVGGFSGGSKACFFNAAWLAKKKYNLVGAYLGGCNHDTSEENRDEIKSPAAGFRKLKVYLGTGKQDNIATPAQAEGVQKSLKDNGIRNVRLELHEGGHSMSKEQFVAALKWFAEPDKS